MGLGDSAGKADPIHTERILRGILERFRPEQISLHIHNTEGFGLANLSLIHISEPTRP